MNEDTLLNIVKSEGRLPIDLVADDVKQCYSAFEKFLADNCEDVIQKITNISFPSVPFNEKLKRSVESVLKMTNLTSFTFRGGRKNKSRQLIKGDIANLPQGMQKLAKIKYLDLSFNCIGEIPEWVFKFFEMQRLLLDFCSIKELSPNVQNYTNIKEIHLKGNNLSTLPKEISCLQTLERLNLSSNKLEQIPDAIGKLQNLTYLDMSENKIKGNISSLPKLTNLEIIKLRDNEIDSVDDDFVKMTSIKSFDLRFNKIRQISTKLQCLESTLLDGNPIGYRSPDKNSKSPGDDLYDVPAFDMKYNTNCVKINAEKGGSYRLPCGVTITVPKLAKGNDVTINSQILADTDVDFVLEDLDELLSGVLELTPSGLTFDNPVRISMPYTFERHDQQIRETVMRVMSSDGTMEDLETTISTIETEDGNICIAEAYTSHFSMFGVIARVMEATTVIQQDTSRLLFSPAYPQTKIKFQEGSVADGTKVTMKVISIDPSIVEEASQSKAAAASCVLSVHVFPHNTIFQKPVTVRIALPDQLLGKDFDHNDLRLMKCAHDSTEWQDVTTLNPLIISSVNVSFQVWSFSKFVVVTETICGAVRYIYRRLRTHKVQFIAMQRHSLPTQVLAQCVLEKKVLERIKQLSRSGYSGEDSVTQVQEMVEGSVFKIKVIGDLKLQTFKEKLAHRVQEKTVTCKFFSQYPPDKKGFSRFFIEHREEPKKYNTGFVSFFKVEEDAEQVAPIKGKVVGYSQESMKQKRNVDNETESQDIEPQDDEIFDSDEFDDENHLGDVPIVLEGNDLERIVNTSKNPEFDFGGLGTGMFREDNLRLLANNIDENWREIGTYLDLPCAQLDHISSNYNPMSERIFRMLKSWSDLHRTDENCIEQFTDALSMAGRNDLVLKVKSLYEEGKKEFHNSVKSMKLG